MKEQLIKWVQSQQNNLDEIISNSAKEFYKFYSEEQYFEFDTQQTAGKEEGLWVLLQGEDLCYDRPTIGFTYSLWYHAKRVNTFMKFIINQIWEGRNEAKIEIFDLGAGTGAIQWAVAIVCEGLRNLDLPVPKIRIVNVDTSPFMLDFNERYLWKQFIIKYPSFIDQEKFKTEFKLNSWSNTEEINNTNIWLCASYLFDHTENKQEIKKDFEELIKTFKPSKVLMLTSNQTNKKDFLNEVANQITSNGYYNYTGDAMSQIFSGSLNTTNNFRNEINIRHNLGFSGVSKWDIDSLYGRVLIKNQMTLSLSFENIKLYTASEKDRQKIKLSPEQEKASIHIDSPTLITGPAGCGKSVVLTERIKNLVEKSNYSTDIKILLTCFNKGLIKYLGDWLEQILDSKKCERIKGTDFNRRVQEFSYFKFNGSATYNIYILHFDLLPTKIGSFNWKKIKPNNSSLSIEKFHYETMKQISERFILENELNERDFKSILDPHFLIDEYHRIIYGLECLTAKDYQILERTGRGNNPTLRFNSKKRKVVWDIIISYINYLRKNDLESFIIRRYKFLKRIKTPLFQNEFKKFTNIFVDELQDCTRADYEIFYTLIDNPNHIVLAGDIAQSINLGAACHIPKTDDQRRFKQIYLNGSFRLPFRISECIKPISIKIKEKIGDAVSVINPYKGSPPGARPIIIFGESLNETANKIKDVFECYKIFGLQDITIFEKDELLKDELISLGVKTSTETTLRMKGLEKPCVLWSVSIDVDTEKEVYEFVYTILTRTSSVLLIVLSNDIKEKYIEIMKLFDQKRLIFWDIPSKVKFSEICKSQTPIQLDDEDNTETVEITETENINDLIET